MSDRLFDIMTAMVERYAAERKLSFTEAFAAMALDREGPKPLLSLQEYHQIIIDQRERHHQENLKQEERHHRETIEAIDRLIVAIDKGLVRV